MSFADKCQHCEHATGETRCCFCKKYVLKSGNIGFTHPDKKIVMTDVGEVAPATWPIDSKDEKTIQP